MNEETPIVRRAEYLIAIKRGAESTGLEIAKRALADALEEHWEEGAARRAWQYISEQYERVAGPKDAATGELLGPTLYGFQLELTEEVDSPALVIKDVSESLRRDADVEHVIKFYDSLVEEENLKRARELFTLEMRLRRAISFVYLYAYGGTYYDLLRNDNLGTDGRLRKRMPKPEELRGQAENEFFHLLFNHYGELNVRRDTRQIDDLIKQLAASADFAALQRELQRMPVEDEDDRKFLDRIKRDLNPAEELRNCVMHSRSPTDDQIASYKTARDALNKAMDEFFQKWAIRPTPDGDEGEWTWDTATREAVEEAMDSAEWNEEDKTIELHDPDEPRITKRGRAGKSWSATLKVWRAKCFTQIVRATTGSSFLGATRTASSKTSCLHTKNACRSGSVRPISRGKCFGPLELVTIHDIRWQAIDREKRRA